MKRYMVLAAMTAAGVAVSTNAALSTPQLSRDTVRAFAEAQNRAWSARDFARYYGTFDPRAEIVTVKTTRSGKLTPTVNSPTEDKKETERFFGSTRASIHETDRIEKIEIAPDGQRARVWWVEETTVTENGKSHLLHADAEEELARRNGRIVAIRLMEKR